MIRWFEAEHNVPHGDSYDERWKRMEESGEYIHGEADLIEWFEAKSVLDAGCGTGRLAIELDRRGIDVVGVDIDSRMLDVARSKAPHLRWILSDVVDVTVPVEHQKASGLSTQGDNDPTVQSFDVVVLAGNVMLFIAADTEIATIANMARHVAPGGRLIAGFQLGRTLLDLQMYDAAARDAGLRLEHRWSTWERTPYEGGDYVVSVHRALES